MPDGSWRPSLGLGGARLSPPGSTELVRLDEEDAGLLGFSEASGDSDLRLGVSERSRTTK